MRTLRVTHAQYESITQNTRFLETWGYKGKGDYENPLNNFFSALRQAGINEHFILFKRGEGFIRASMNGKLVQFESLNVEIKK